MTAIHHTGVRAHFVFWSETDPPEMVHRRAGLGFAVAVVLQYGQGAHTELLWTPYYQAHTGLDITEPILRPPSPTETELQ